MYWCSRGYWTVGIHNSTAIGAGSRVYESNTIQLGNGAIEQVVTTGVITGKAKISLFLTKF